MKKQYDLSGLDWKLSGWTPYYWRLHQTMEIGANPNTDIAAVPAKVPGSVQYALREAGVIPDWNVGLNSRECEWVEHRHWVYETSIPDGWVKPGMHYRLNCQGLDYNGWIYVNNREVAKFEGSHTPYLFDITDYLQEQDNHLRIVFGLPPNWLGQFGFTEEMTEWKPRFNYTWDWVVRVVQIGIWDTISIEETDGREIADLRCYTNADSTRSTGSLRAWGSVVPEDAQVRVALSRDGSVAKEETIAASDFNRNGIDWSDIPVALWWPNLHGEQPLYDLTCTLIDANGSKTDSTTRRVGFKDITWQCCDGACKEADPWICVANGKPIFLQGANWTPILPNFADVTEEDYRKRLKLYRDLGFNILRVWGGAVLEREYFYHLCDEYGLMVWQEFPLSSSGGSSYPPDDEKSISELSVIAESFISRRQHHASLLIWSGGNELTSRDDSIPASTKHPLIARFKEIIDSQDPTHRFIPTSASGPTTYGHAENFGKGVHWDVHGPWKCNGHLDEWTSYWSRDDALIRSETGAPGASPVDIIRQYAGDCDVMPAVWENPYWRRGSTWWVEWPQFVAEHSREPESLEEYVEWSQERQKQALVFATKACKGRFPKCGGIIFWMGHDCFPCTANTAIIDFHGNPKPAALAVGEVFRDQ